MKEVCSEVGMGLVGVMAMSGQEKREERGGGQRLGREMEAVDGDEWREG